MQDRCCISDWTPEGCEGSEVVEMLGHLKLLTLCPRDSESGPYRRVLRLLHRPPHLHGSPQDAQHTRYT